MQKDESRILDILLAASDVAEIVSGKTFDEYKATMLLRAGVERKVYIIGEAVRYLSDAFKQAHPTVPGSQIIGSRNILAHDYNRVNDKIMWETATVHVPVLANYLKPFGPHEVEE